MQFDIFYQLPVSSDQNTARRYREMIEEAVEADRLGFGTVWLAEIHFMPKFCVLPAPMMLLAAIAERTTRIRLGQAVNLLPLHHPVRLAEEAATLRRYIQRPPRFRRRARRVPDQLSGLRRRYSREPRNHA